MSKKENTSDFLCFLKNFPNLKILIFVLKFQYFSGKISSYKYIHKYAGISFWDSKNFFEYKGQYKKHILMYILKLNVSPNTELFLIYNDMFTKIFVYLNIKHIGIANIAE